MLIIIATADSREKNVVRGTTPAVNNNPTATKPILSVRSRFMPSVSRSQLGHHSASGYCDASRRQPVSIMPEITNKETAIRSPTQRTLVVKFICFRDQRSIFTETRVLPVGAMSGNRKISVVVRVTSDRLDLLACGAQEPDLPSQPICPCWCGQRVPWFTSLQLRKLGFGLLQDRDVGIGVFPEGEEALVSSFRSGSVTRHRVSATELKTGEGTDR